jgi:O-antigen ligase
MPEHLRALVVIVTLALIVFSGAKRLFAGTIELDVFNRWRNLWLALTLVAFLSHSFWLYALFATLILLVVARRDGNPAALFCASLFAVPAAGIQVPGFGLVNYLITLSHTRILVLCLLLPAWFVLRSRGDRPAFGKLWPDRLLLLYSILVVALQLRETTLTDTMRQGFYVMIDALLPYYVLSRTLKHVDAFRQVLAAFLLAAVMLAAFAVFESVRHWNLYSAVIIALDPKMGYGAYLGREGLLRASASTGHAIALGYVMAVAVGFYLYWQDDVRDKLIRRIGWLGLLAGLIVPLSRGPWVGAAVIILMYLATGRAAFKRLMLLALGGVVVLPFVSILPGGQRILEFLPFIGTVEKDNIDYRGRLIDNALIVIERNPVFGSVDYQNTPEMEAMRQGQGIIDIVNTYIGVALAYGLVGLSLFVGFFFAVLWGIRKAMRSFNDPDEEMARLGRALFATLTGILVIIFTVSSITIIPIVYWSVAGLGVAYTQMVREHHRTGRESEIALLRFARNE